MMDKTWIKTGSNRELLLNLLKEKMVKKNKWERFLENSKETFPLDELTNNAEPEMNLKNQFVVDHSIFDQLEFFSRSVEGVDDNLNEMIQFKESRKNKE